MLIPTFLGCGEKDNNTEPPEVVNPNDIDDDGDGVTENQGDCDDNDSSLGAISEDADCDGIRTNLNNELLYANKQQVINNNNKELNTLIPEYENVRKELIDTEQKYVSSHIQSSNQTGVRIMKKQIMDNNELYLSSKLLFTLGTVSVTTLLVFAIVLARD